MSKKVLTTNNEEQLQFVSNELAKMTKTNKLFLFNAEMGLGKTTLIKRIALDIGVKDLVNSPTYSIVNEYRLTEDRLLYHFDLYRLSEDELFDIGFEDYFKGDNLVFIEWPEIGSEFYPSDYVDIKITRNEDKRVYEISIIGS